MPVALDAAPPVPVRGRHRRRRAARRCSSTAPRTRSSRSITAQRLFARARGAQAARDRSRGGHIYANPTTRTATPAGIHDFLTERGRLDADAAATRRPASPCASALDTRRRRAPRSPRGAPLPAKATARWNLAEYELAARRPAGTLAERHADARSRVLRANRDRFPTSPLAWYELGRALAAAGDRDDARAGPLALARRSSRPPINPSHEALAALASLTPAPPSAGMILGAWTSRARPSSSPAARRASAKAARASSSAPARRSSLASPDTARGPSVARRAHRTGPGTGALPSLRRHARRRSPGAGRRSRRASTDASTAW